MDKKNKFAPTRKLVKSDGTVMYIFTIGKIQKVNFSNILAYTIFRAKHNNISFWKKL